MEKKLQGICFFASFLAVGCSLFGGGTREIRRAEHYQLDAPKTWRESSSRGESDHAYILSSNKKIAVSSFCDRNREASLKVLTRQILMGSRNIKVLDEKELLVESGAGLFTYVQATSEGTPFFLGIAIVKKLGCVFDFSLVSPVPISSAETTEFITFVKSLHYGTH